MGIAFCEVVNPELSVGAGESKDAGAAPRNKPALTESQGHMPNPYFAS